MSNINGDAGTDQMSAALKDAAGDLEVLANENLRLQQEFEGHNWSGLDVLSGNQQKINAIRDSLVVVADLIGVGGQIVRDAHTNNDMIRNASKASLGHA